MKLVIDSNEIFSFFNEKSKAREIALLPNIELHSPEFCMKEIEKHKEDIIEKFVLSETQYLMIHRLLQMVVTFSNEKEYAGYVHEAKKLCPDKDDVDFFALALKLRCPIWSEDKALKNQPKVKVYSTSELLNILYL